MLYCLNKYTLKYVLLKYTDLPVYIFTLYLQVRKYSITFQHTYLYYTQYTYFIYSLISNYMV